MPILERARPARALALLAIAAVLALWAPHGRAADQPRQIAETKAERNAADRMAWARRIALTHEFLVQLAMRAGLDPERAERLRAIYAAHRGRQRAILGDMRMRKIDRAEFRRRARASARLRDKAIEALLKPAERAALNRDDARFLTALTYDRIEKVAR